MICQVCKQEFSPGHLVIQVPVICRAEQSLRDPTRLYFVPQSSEADIIHYHCLREYLDPRTNDDLVDSAKEQVRDEVREGVLEESSEYSQQLYEQAYSSVIDEFEERGWLSPRYYEENR